MMVTPNQIKRGLGSFISTEIMPHIPGGSFKRVAVGTVLDLFLDNVEKMISDGDGTIYSILGIKDEAGSIDLQRLAEKLKANIPDTGEKINLNILGFRLGDMTFHKSDVDALVRHIMNA